MPLEGLCPLTHFSRGSQGARRIFFSDLEVSEPSSLLENLPKSIDFLRIVKKKTGFESEKPTVDLNGPDGPGALDASRL